MLGQKRNALALVSAVLAALAMPPIGFKSLAWIALVPLFYTLNTPATLKQNLLTGFLYGFLFNAILFLWCWGLHPLMWMGVTPFQSLLISGGMWLAIVTVQAVGLSVMWAILCWLDRVLPLWSLLLISLLWPWALYAMNFNPLGVSVGFLAYSQASNPWVLPSVAYLSGFGLESALIGVNLLLAQALWRKHWPWAGMALAVLLGVITLSQFAGLQTTSIPKALKVIALQGNIPIEADKLFLTSAQKAQYYQTLIEKSLPKTITQPTWVVLPEGTLDLRRNPNPINLPKNVTLVSGAIFNGPQGVQHGLVVMYAKQPPQFFAKRYLVSFGETTPWIPAQWLKAFLANFGVSYSLGFQAGDLHQPLPQVDGLTILPWVCFESLYPNLGWAYRQQHPDIAIGVSNLGWYHQHPGLTQQYLAANQIRAAELGVPMILVSNTGPTAIIAPDGHIILHTIQAKMETLLYRF